jgi:hypothetical protein
VCRKVKTLDLMTDIPGPVNVKKFHFRSSDDSAISDVDLIFKLLRKTSSYCISEYDSVQAHFSVAAKNFWIQMYYNYNLLVV